MKLDLFDINAFIRANNCPEVTNPIFFNYDGNPTPDGLFSYELFGFTDEERKNIFGYIDLKGNYVHPLIYVTMIAKMGSLGKILIGEKYAVIADKKIKIVDEDFEGARTGVDFLYDNFEYINWIDEIDEEEIDSLDKKTRLKFFKSLKKEEFFVNKWLVLPPFYRAESSTNKSMGDDINKLYKELLSKVRGMNLGFSFDVFGAETKLRVQNILKDLYLSTIAPISGKNLILEKGKSEGTLAGAGKNSMIRKHLLGKTVDWSSSSVITSPHNSDANRPEEKPVPWGYGAFPLASLLSMFQPFYVNWCVDFMEVFVNFIANLFATDIKKINLAQYNSERIEKLIKKFIKDPEDRFENITIDFVGKDGVEREYRIPFFEYKTLEDAENFENYISRPFTLTDLLYIASTEILTDKHIYVTRFPIANFQNIYPSKIKILSTAKTRKIYYNFGKSYDLLKAKYDDKYPTIPAQFNENDRDSDFYDVMICGNAYLASLGGDYDGDMLYMRALFSQEANAEAEKLVWAKTNMLNASGKVSRALSEIGKENVMGLYELTKEVE